MDHIDKIIISSAPDLQPHTILGKAHSFLEEKMLSFLKFVRSNPDKFGKKTNEDTFNEFLATHLNDGESVFIATHEASDGKRRNDVALYLKGSGKTGYPKIFAIEGKRLPAPSGKNRKKEYLYSNLDGKINGGVERFKLGLHAGDLNESAIVAYVQKSNISNWEKTINSWIDELINKSNHIDISWGMDDKLNKVKVLDCGCEKFESNNSRKTEMTPIKLYHYFLSVCT